MTVTTDPSVSLPRVVRDCTLDWAKVDAAVARDGSLDPTAKALYMALATFVDKNGRQSDKNPDGYDVPTRKALAECIGKDVKTVDRATERLEQYRIEGLPLLEVERRRDPHNPKVNLPNIYRLLDTDRWDKRAGERFAAKRSRGRDTGVPRGRDIDDATPRGGRDTGVPRGRDTSVAVPITTQKTHHTTAHESTDVEANAVQSETSGGGVPQENLDVLQEVLRPDAHEALTIGERRSLAAAVDQLLGTGWTIDAIRARKPDRRVNVGTTHPATHIRRALETLAAEAAPNTTAPSPRRSSVADCTLCDPNGLVEVDDGTPDGRLVRCPHDGSIVAAAEPESTSDPERLAQARAALTAFAESMNTA